MTPCAPPETERKTPSLSASLEDYLEAILFEVQDHQVARVKDVAARLDVNKSSVSNALRLLRDRDLVEHDPYGFIRLTPEGDRAARGVAGRHKALRLFFTDFLGIEEFEADRAACIMEHALPPVVEERLSGFMEFLERKDCMSDWRRECGGAFSGGGEA